MTVNEESPNKDIDDFIKMVYEEEVIKIKPIAGQFELSYRQMGSIHTSYILTDLLDEYVTKYRRYIPKIDFSDLSSFSFSDLQEKKPVGNPYSGKLRMIIQALKSRGLTEESSGLPIKYKNLLDELQKRTSKLETVSEAFDKSEIRIKELEEQLKEANDAIDEFQGLRK